MEPTDPTASEPSVQENQNSPHRGLKAKVLFILLLVLIITSVIFGTIIMLKKWSSREVVPPPTPQIKSSAQVSIIKNAFVPAFLTIKKGTEVSWTIADEESHRVASNPHPSHSQTPGLDSKDSLGPDSSYSFTFDQPGTYSYHDHMNPTVSGTIQVTE